MSTSAVIPSQNSVATLPIKNEVITFAVVVKLGEDQKIKSVRHTSSEKDIAALSSPDYEAKTPEEKREIIAFTQNVTKPSAGTLEGFAQLVPDADTQLDIVNKGLSAKFNQKIRTKLVELDEAGNLVFQPTDAAYDATGLVQEISERTTLSPMDKAMKTLAGLPADMLAAVLAQFAASAQGK